MSEMVYPKEYHIRSYRLNFLLWIGFCIATAWSLIKLGNLILRRPEYWFIVITAPIQIYFMVYLFYFVKDFRLRISESGIDLIIWSRIISATWAQVKSLDRAYFQNQLVLDSPTVEKRKTWRFLPDFLSFRSDKSFRRIPLSKITWEKYGEIEAEVRKHAPHVFTQKAESP